ncbi:MAG TPA: protein kinase [Baekduia sp.]|uniref:protein kinase domain-containing protein n=1 Tax=Baekduia sp. TaxID=2600305 RepID=UPI002D79D31D|nr:protein kinase [Baekduia sp.]HET6508834.1 protein kinase [Baekduia sp.]
MSSQVGTLLNGRYRLDAQIGTGGMSTVYRAFDTVLERQVAIKLMHREIASDSDQLERFRREARAVAQLNHPHIVTVIDAGEDDNMPYIVFEYVEGETLKDRIRRYGRLPIQESIAYAIEIARALGVAHDRGIVHRDVKPQNVLVDEEGSAKVTDFGIARTLDQEGLTADGRVLGTTDYVSPEQALGHPVTGQSDLYSLGIVLFEMLTGDVPFKGDNQVAVAMKHVREQLPDVRIRRPEVSSALAAVLERATAKETEQRYPDDRALIAALEEVLAIETQRSGQSTGEATAVLRTLPASAQRRLPTRVIHPVRLIAALVVIAAVVVAVVLLLADNTHRGTQQRPVVNSAPAQGVKSVSLGQSRAHDFDPYGNDHHEHSRDVGRVLDGDPGTAWTTETYRGGFGTKPGVGIYIDAKPGVVGKRIEIRTTTTGWTGKIYVANSVDPNATNLDGWQDIGANIDATSKSIAVPLDTAGQKFRYYLIWIDKLPPSGQVGISEIVLFQPRG